MFRIVSSSFLLILICAGQVCAADEVLPNETTVVVEETEAVTAPKKVRMSDDAFSLERLRRMKGQMNGGATEDVKEPLSERETPSYGKAVKGLFLCLGVFFVGVYLFKKFNGGSGEGGSNRLAISERLSLGNKSSVILVRIDGAEVLLGVTESGISRLQELPRKQMKAKPIALETSRVVHA